tara:strand:- start:12814 stop:14112 length:1299 start_codon:yes stop_codon:yes gene_type:complete
MQLYYFKILFLIPVLILFSCTTTVDEDINIVKIESKGGDVALEYEYEEQIECEEDAPPCDVLSSWVYDAYISNEFDEVVNEAKHAIACNCAVMHADQIYAFLARAYVELGEDDKATKSIDKGLSYSSENLELIELAVWNAKRLKNVEDEISYLELLLTIKNDSNTYEKLADVYRREKKYNEQIRVLKGWLKIDPDNDKPNQELKLAFKKTGRDEFEIDKQRCEKNPENFEFCFEYASNLIKSKRFNEALLVMSDIKKRHPKNEKLLRSMGEVSINNYDTDNALEIYKQLVKINGDEILYLLEISKIYQDKEKFGQAHKFAKKALKIDTSSEAIFNFAELLKNSVESCSKEALKLEDKAVYEISYRYYKQAYKKGNKESKNMISWFKENESNVLPTLEDWFLIDNDNSELKPIEINPNNSCYSWVEQSVERVN